MAERFDAIVIGAGQAGPALCARLDAQGLKTAIGERKLLGGTCVNVGCIPTKTLVGSAHAIHMARPGDVFRRYQLHRRGRMRVAYAPPPGGGGNRASPWCPRTPGNSCSCARRNLRRPDAVSCAPSSLACGRAGAARGQLHRPCADHRARRRRLPCAPSPRGQGGISGGRTYDALIAECALKAGAAVVLTFNATHYAHLDAAGVRVVAPSVESRQ